MQWLDDRGITPYIRVKECPTPTPDLYKIDKFTYVPEENYETLVRKASP